MKERYRLFLRRKSVYYAFDNTTKTFQSLKTKDRSQAVRLLLALNEAGKQPAMNLGLARVYLKHSDPLVSQRTWQHVLDEIIKLKSGPTQYRWQTAAKDKAFDLIRSRLLIDTQAEHLLEVLRKGTVSTNAYLRRTHNFAIDMNWLPATVIPHRQCLVSKARSRSPCSSIPRSPISSRKSKPLSAVSTDPLRSAVAPVKAPLRCPNSADMAPSPRIVVQSTVTGASPVSSPRCFLKSKMRFANSDLPAPVGPKMSIGLVLLAATRSIKSMS